MHHYSTSTWQSLSVRDASDINTVIRVRIPQFAFEHDFLMNALLGTASAHLQYLDPTAKDTRRQTDLYRSKTLNTYRKALSQISSANYVAVLLTGLLLLALASGDNPTGKEDELRVMQWLTLYGGLINLINMRYQAISEANLLPLFVRELDKLSDIPSVPTVLSDLFASIDDQDPDYQQLHTYNNVLTHLGILYASLRSEGIGPAHSVRVVVWPTFLPAEFVTLARQKRSRTLIILAYYLVFVKFLPDNWWFEGMADHDIRLIVKTVGPEWLSSLRIPLQAAQMSDLGEISRLMLSS